MTAPTNGPQEGHNGSGTGTEQQQGAAGAQGGSGAGNGQQGTDGGEGSKPTYADVLAALSDDDRAAVIAEVSKKNSEARTQRQRAKAAEERLAASSTQAGTGDSSGAAGGEGEQQQRQAGSQQQPPAGSRPDTQVAAARVAVARSKVEAIAATAGFADPEDAIAHLGDLTGYVDTDFTVDADSIRTDVDELLVKKPYLKRAESGGQQGGRPGRPAPDRSQGSSANGTAGQRTGVDAGADLYRQRHSRAGAGASS